MKKLTMIFAIMILSATVAFGQPGIETSPAEDLRTAKNIGNELVKEITGSIILSETESEDNGAHVIIKVPDYFDFELVSMHIDLFTSQFTDINIFQPWKYDSMGDPTMGFNSSKGVYVFFSYSSDDNYLYIIVF